MTPRKARAPKRNASLPADLPVANDGALVLAEEPGHQDEYGVDTFPDEPESVDSLRPVIPTPEDTPPARLSNAEKVARQRQVFSSGDEDELPDDPRMARQLAGLEAEQSALTAPKPRPAPRRITAELVKAETLLVRLERRRQDSLAHAETVWAGKRRALIESLPADVVAALIAMHVLEDADIEGLWLMSEG
jgi:hypothetical protein